MNVVYIVHRDVPYEFGEVQKVYSERRLAEAYVESLSKDDRRYVDIEAWDVHGTVHRSTAGGQHVGPSTTFNRGREHGRIEGRREALKEAVTYLRSQKGIPAEWKSALRHAADRFAEELRKVEEE